MDIRKEYKFIMRTEGESVYVTPPVSLIKAIHHLLIRLKQMNALDCINMGYFVDTVNPFKKNVVCKRFVVEVNVPKCDCIIFKITKGSIHKEEFVSLIKSIKEKYYERI